MPKNIVDPIKTPVDKIKVPIEPPKPLKKKEIEDPNDPAKQKAPGKGSKKEIRDPRRKLFPS